MANKKNRQKKAAARLPTPPPIADDEDNDLMNDLLSVLDSKSSSRSEQEESAEVLKEMHLNAQADQLEGSSKMSAKARFKARQARKAAALADSFSPDDPANQARLAAEAKQEEEDIGQVCKEMGVGVQEINPDGHCLFSAMADQLGLLGILPPQQCHYSITRAAAADYMLTHPDDFLPFLPASDDMSTSGLMTPEQYSAYCSTVRSTAFWGGEPEILALCRAFNVPIHIVQGGKPSVVVHEPSSGQVLLPGRLARISYHRKMYGLGEHYNSLRPITA